MVYCNSMTGLPALRQRLAQHSSLLIGYSGGVDSALLAVVARSVLGRRGMLTALGISPSLSAVQREQAIRIAREFDFPLLEVPTDELSVPGYVANAPDRCYFCKATLWMTLTDLAATRGFGAVADGTNADDLSEHRPGSRAASEFRVVSPLADAGMGKQAVRDAARGLGIPIWDAPAAPCLASRILYGLHVTPTRLRQVEEGEALLRGFGIKGDLRLRHRDDEARIEVNPAEVHLVRMHSDGVVNGLRVLGFSRVVLDLNGYRRGSLLRDEGERIEVLGGGADPCGRS